MYGLGLKFKIFLNLNLLIEKGFVLEEFCEPYIDDETLERYPEEYTSRIIPYFLIIRCRKPNKK